MKKVCSILLTLVLIMSIPVPSFAVEVGPKSTTPIISSAESNLPMTRRNRMTEAELRAMYWASSEFQKFYENDPDDALASLDKAVEDYYVSLPSSTYSTASYTAEDIASVSAVLVQQLNSYSCGPASAYMAIDGWSGTGSISGTTDTAKLQRLASQMNTNETDGTVVATLTGVLNGYVNSKKYSYYLGSTLDEFHFRVYAFNSLSYERAPILHAKTGALSYYNGFNRGHYITVTQFDYNTMEVRLHDPNYRDDYYGIHYIPYEEAHSSVADYSDRYFICYWP